MKIPGFITWKRLLILSVLVILFVTVGFVAWASSTNPLMPQAEAALQNSEMVNVVRTGDFIAFEPSGVSPSAGFIMYPGGRVLAEAYAPMLHALAEEGYLAAVVYAPLNLAILNTNAAQSVIEAYPAVVHWVVGGHSLGGVVASSFASGHPAVVRGLVLLASVPFPGLSLHERDDLVVVSVYASLDGLLAVDEVLASATELPSGAVFVEIAGGNHAGFGWYGDQAGDNPAVTAREVQQEQIIRAVTELLQGLPDGVSD